MFVLRCHLGGRIARRRLAYVAVVNIARAVGRPAEPQHSAAISLTEFLIAALSSAHAKEDEKSKANPSTIKRESLNPVVWYCITSSHVALLNWVILVGVALRRFAYVAVVSICHGQCDGCVNILFLSIGARVILCHLMISNE